MTAAGLNGALAGAVSEAQGIRPILPWRRDMERRCPARMPESATESAIRSRNPDPEPQPIDDGATPDVRAGRGAAALVGSWFRSAVRLRGRPRPRLRQEAEREAASGREVTGVCVVFPSFPVTDSPLRAASQTIGEEDEPHRCDLDSGRCRVRPAGREVGKWLFGANEKLMAKKRAAQTLAAKLRDAGLKLLPALLEDFAVGDVSDMLRRFTMSPSWWKPATTLSRRN